MVYCFRRLRAANSIKSVIPITKTYPCIMQQFLKLEKMIIFKMKTFDIFLTFAQNIDCEYTLEPPQRGGSNEYPQSMF